MITNTGDLDGTEYFYYNNRWQMLESRNGSETLITQTVYGTRYVDEIVRWWKDRRGVMYVFQDANWNVTGTISYAAIPLDRVRTTPYGEPIFDAETVNGDFDGDGDVDTPDLDATMVCFSTGLSGDCRAVDYDANGTINIWDYLGQLALFGIQRQPGRRTSPNRFPHAHQGLYLDEETLTYQNRRRQYNPWQKRFMQRDPVAMSQLPRRGYHDGGNLYAYLKSNPITQLDPSGLITVCSPCRFNQTCTVRFSCGACGAPGVPPGMQGCFVVALQRKVTSYTSPYTVHFDALLA